MPGSRPDLEAAAERPVRLVARRDLVAAPMEFRGRRMWHLKDPVSLRYYQLRDEEYFVWGLLDGHRSLDEIRVRCAAQFAPRRVEVSHLQGYLALLHREGLVVADVPAQGVHLLARGRTKRTEARWAVWTNPLAIRFRGLNPDRLLTWLHARLRWLFRPAFLVVLAAAVLGAWMLLVTHWDEVLARMPRYAAFFQGQNLLWFALALALVKIVHELAHGLTCKHFGAECTELGVMLLVFTPCLYCNVSDAWTLPNKWQRMLVSGAGIVAELGLAAVATGVWWWTELGRLQALCLHVVLICSVGTLLLNGNPLLRYDGYYLLADWLEIPNLQTQASSALRRIAGRLFLGFDPESDRIEPAPAVLVVYAMLSLIYRGLILATIVWFLYAALARLGLPTVAGLVVLVAVTAAIVVPLQRLIRWAKNPGERARVKIPRLGLTSGAALAAILLLGFWPLPRRISAPAVLRPAEATAVYATVSGQLVSAVDEGHTVARGTVLAELRNPELAREVRQLIGQRAAQQQQVQNLQRQQLRDPQAAAELPAAEKTLQAIDEQLQDRQLHEQRLKIATPADGTVLPPPPRSGAAARGTLALWSGSPLEPRNRGAFVEAGTLLCYVGDPRQLEVILVIDQAVVGLVAVGQRVQVRLAGGPVAALQGEIRAISEVDIDDVPPELMSTGELPVERGLDGESRLVSASYQAIVRLEPHHAPLLPGLVGQARITVARQSLFSRLRRFLGQTFRFAV